MSHQAYGPRTGVPRILRMLARRGVRATFFIPGYTAERWPDAVRAIRDDGHEIAHHGYLHEGSRTADALAEERHLLRGLEAIERVLGSRPAGYRAPSWEASYRLPELLQRHGFLYDSSLMDSDEPYRLATSDDPRAPSIVELPVHWSLDDWEPYAYLPGITGSGVIAHPDEVTARWRAELDAMTLEGGVFILTSHPFLSGRPSRALALERLIEHAQRAGAVWIATCDEIAREAESRSLPTVTHRPHRLDDPASPSPRQEGQHDA
jgi:peptidoglycan/xylan/chitin deacetylase (PgdA/CDA1 family)